MTQISDFKMFGYITDIANVHKFSATFSGYSYMHMKYKLDRDFNDSMY